MDLTSQVVALKQVQTQASAQFLMIKKQQEMDMMLLQTMDAVTKSAPAPPGSGTRVDKSA